MLRFRFVCFFVCLIFIATLNKSLFAATNPLPLIYQPLNPASVRPGSAAFTLTVNGTHFVSGAVVQWNGSSLVTTFVSRSRLRAVVPAARVAKANTAAITVANPASGAQRSNVIYLPVRLPSSTVTFKVDGAVTTAGGVTTGDFNGDGNADIIVGPNSTSLKIDSFLGKGNGTFTAHVAATTNLFPPVGGIAADMNGDGKSDLIAVLNGEAPFLFGQVFLGKGDGTFTDSGAGGSMQGVPVGVGDFRAIGKLDVVSASNNSSLQGSNVVGIYSGNGDGTVAAFENLAQGAFLATGFPAVADFNSDGKLDLALAGVSLYLGNGDGTFQPPLNSPGNSTFSVVAADLNGDGKLDLVSDGTCVFIGHGNGTFSQGQCLAYPAGLTITFFDLADMNGDGKLDIVAVAADENNGSFPQTLFLALGNRNGSFQKPKAVAPAGDFNIVLATGLGIADFNHDGKLDVVVSSLNRSFVYLQQ